MATLAAKPTHWCTPRAWLAYGNVLLAIVAAFIIVCWLRPHPAFPYDDAFIVLHSAQVLHSGADLNYPGVAPLFGVTSAPFLGLVYLLMFVLPAMQALNLACWIGVLFYALGLLRMARVIGLRSNMLWILVLIGLLCAPVPIHWLNGLETSCALATLTWTLAFATGNRFRDRLAAAFLAGVSASVRPDLLPFALILVLFMVWKAFHASRVKSGWLPIFALFLAAAVPIALCAAWYLHQTGSPIPLTGVAKKYFFAEDHAPLLARIKDLSIQLVLFGVAIGPVILIVPRMARFAMGKTLLLVMALFVAALFVQFPQNFDVNEFRYPVVLIPMLLWGLGMTVTCSDDARGPSKRWLIYASLAYSLAMLPLCFHLYHGERVSFESGPRQVTVWCVRNLPSGAPILVHDAGYLAYSSSFRTVDFVGLKTPSAIPLNRQYTWPSAGRDRDRVVAAMALQTGSQVLILNIAWPPVVRLPEELRSLGWQVDLLHTAGGFQIYRLTPPS